MRPIGYALASTAWMLSVVAHAQSVPTLHVAWNAPTACGSEYDVVARVRDQLPAMTLPPMSARVYVATSSDTMRMAVVFDLNDDLAIREFEVRDCDNAEEIASVVIALALQEQITAAAIVAPEPAQPDAEQPLAAQPSPAPHDVPAPSEEGASPSLSLEASFLAASGSAPNAAFGFAIGLAARFGSRWSIFLRADNSLPSTSALLPGSDVGARFSRNVGVAGFGYTLRWPSVAITPLAAIAFGDLNGEGVELANAASLHRLWLAPRVGVTAELPLSASFSFVASLEAEFPLSRSTFSIAGFGTVFQAPAVAANARIGFAWTFL